jgi:hypothetical protein
LAIHPRQRAHGGGSEETKGAVAVVVAGSGLAGIVATVAIGVHRHVSGLSSNRPTGAPISGKATITGTLADCTPIADTIDASGSQTVHFGGPGNGPL